MSVPVVKRVAALAGDLVCAESGIVIINHHVAAQTLRIDREGRPLPAWHGCRTLDPGEVFLLMAMCPRPSTAGISGRSRRLRSSGGSCRYGLGDAVHGLHGRHRHTWRIACPPRPPLMDRSFPSMPVSADRPIRHGKHIGDRPRSPPAIDRWQRFIVEASNRFGVPEVWIRAVMAAESAGQTVLDGRPITSPAGAMGLMQVMPETYAEMRLRHGLGADPYDPSDNILAGVAYLRAMYDRYGYPGFFAAYNAGPARFDDYLLRGVSLPDETLHYLLSISSDLREVVAERPDAAARLLAGALVPSHLPREMPCFSSGEPHRARSPASMRTTNGDLSVRFFDRDPASGGLFVPLGPRGTTSARRGAMNEASGSDRRERPRAATFHRLCTWPIRFPRARISERLGS